MSRPEPAKGIPTPKSRRGFKGFWIEVSRELKKVDWPPVREINRLSIVVLVVCLFVVVVLLLLSQAASMIVTLLQTGRV